LFCGTKDRIRTQQHERNDGVPAEVRGLLYFLSTADDDEVKCGEKTFVEKIGAPEFFHRGREQTHDATFRSPTQARKTKSYTVILC
jgi:hypothetical protein